jgi:hypothetical protein
MKDGTQMIFPLPLPSRVMVAARPALALTVDLPCFEPELWLALVADGKHETGVGDVVGWLLLEKRLTQRPGLTTYAAVAVRPASDPPPNPAAFQTVFQWPSLAVCAALLQDRTSPHD